MPPSVLRCHWIAAVGRAEATMINDTELPSQLFWFVRSVVIVGAKLIVSVSVLVLLLNVASPPYSAAMICTPPASDEVVKLAELPVKETGAPSATPLSRN